MRDPFRFLLALTLSLLAMSNSGCSSESNATSFPVTGSVIVNGKPAAYARLTFRPASEDLQEPPVLAKADENGEFMMYVPVPEAAEDIVKYEVSISWRIPKSPRDRNDPDYGEELLPKKFQDPRQSGLKIEIDPNVTELAPFELNP